MVFLRQKGEGQLAGCITHLFVSDMVSSNLRYYTDSIYQIAGLPDCFWKPVRTALVVNVTLSHMFWSCPTLKDFWEGVFNTITAVWKIKIPPNPVAALFGGVQMHYKISATNATAVAFAPLLARRNILLKWKKSIPLPINDG